MGITTILGMIPKGGKYAKSVVNFVYKTVDDWPKFTEAIKQIVDLLKQGKLRLDGKQKTIFETNKNILKNHEKVIKDITDKWIAETFPFSKKEFPAFNISKTDPFKGWKPTLVERSKLRNIYKELEPPKVKYTDEMSVIDEELDALAFGGDKYAHLSSAEKAKIFKKLQTEMKQLIAKGEDLSKLSLGQINKRIQNIQKRIKDIADNPNIKGTVNKGPKRDMIKAIADSERKGLEDARDVIKLKNAKKKYGDKFPRLDPDNDAFIITGLTESGNPMKVGRFTGRFGATKNPITGELTRKEGTAWYDNWDPKKNQIRKKEEAVWHETVDAEGKTIMSNPDYKVTTKNMDIWNELYNETSISELSKRGFKLQDIDMLVKGRAVNKYLEANKLQTDSTKISDIMEDLYLRGDDVYRMSIEEWTKKIPEYFAHGGSVPGFATGGVSNLFRERQGYRSGEAVIKLAKGARWLLRMLKEMSDDMIFGQKQFANMVESMKMKYYKETQAAIKHLEAGGEIPPELLKTMRADKRFQNLTVSKGGDKDFIEMQEVVLGKPTKGTGEKLLKGETLDETGMIAIPDETMDLMAFKKTLPSELIAKLNKLPVENQTVLLKQFKEAFDATKKGGVEGGIDILQKELLEGFIPKGKPHATGGLIDGYATGGVSNLFRQRQGFRTGNIAKLPEFLKFVERLLIKASNEIRQGIGKWRGLDQKQRIVQHDNLTKLATEFQKTKKFDVRINEYTGIDAEKAFIEAQAKVVPKKTRTMDDLVEDAYKEVFHQKPSSGDYKYDADVLATEIAYQGGKIYDDLAAVEKAGIYDLAYKRVMQDLQINRAKKIAEKNITDLEQKIELQMFDPKGKKGNAEGGLIPGYNTGGVSNLFRRR